MLTITNLETLACSPDAGLACFSDDLWDSLEGGFGFGAFETFLPPPGLPPSFEDFPEGGHGGDASEDGSEGFEYDHIC